ncbi:ATP-binding cassette subfamily C protein [Lactobacillus colini]|uniref:ATP-binding cassette subfamily C protein n=1 Tax=Lactobacillus colini TaxID=1819254 RepID=A0ABS4MFC2_9LACO|nr:ABC transporter ATP-binding protein [Lactobacillus colini]MBP2058318.1 ATP-binding cassette subfamily C protein [Lactobacillus colini]
MLYKYSNKAKFVMMVVVGLVVNLQNILIAYMVQTLTNIATKRSWGNLNNFFLIIGSGFCVILLAGLIFNRLKTSIIQEVNTYLRMKIFSGMINQTKEENETSLGFLTNDFKLLETNRFDAQIEIIMQVFSLVFALSYALSVNLLITILFLVGSFIPMIISGIFQKKIQLTSQKWTAANSKYVNQSKNFIAGSETLQLYHGLASATMKNKQKVDLLELSLRKMNLVSLDTNTWINFIAPVTTFLFPFIFGIYLVVKGQTQLGALFAIVQLANSFVNPILIILEDKNQLSTTKKIVERVNRFIKLDSSQSIAKHEQFNKLSLRGLTLERQGTSLVEKLDFSIFKGDKLAVIGPSGSGKSTLLQYLLTGKYGQAQSIKMDEQELQAGKFKDLFAYASQSPVIFADSLWFNLTLGKDISRENVVNVCHNLGLDSVIKEKGFDYQLGDNADQLSGGQLARIELARAILANRPILLLDEINASLDQKTANQIHNYLLKSDLTFLEVIHHYEKDELRAYDQVINLENYLH